MNITANQKSVLSFYMLGYLITLELSTVWHWKTLTCTQCISLLQTDCHIKLTASCWSSLNMFGAPSWPHSKSHLISLNLKVWYFKIYMTYFELALLLKYITQTSYIISETVIIGVLENYTWCVYDLFIFSDRQLCFHLENLFTLKIPIQDC